MDYKQYQDDEFEQFLQDEVRHHRMYPSDHVWNNIRTEIHGNQTWPALTFIALFVICGLTISTLLMSPSAERIQSIASLAIKPVKTIERTNQITPKESTESYLGVIEPQDITDYTVSSIANNQLQASTYLQQENSASSNIEFTVAIEKNSPSRNEENNSVVFTKNVNAFTANTIAPLNLNTISSKEETLESKELVIPNLLKSIPANQTSIELGDDYLKNAATAAKTIPWKKVSKVGFQFYVTPSKSYRTLSDAAVKEVIQPSTVSNTNTQNVPLGLNYSANVNDIVRHSPSMGIEIGFAALYNISNRLKFKTGVQLNVRQYHIETFKTFSSPSTLSLINNNGIQTVNLFSNYNNNTGFKSEQLNNQTYQVSIPVGVQLELIKGNRIGLNAEASVQPTLSINNSTFLLSTDYKNYTDGNSFIRKWNVNTSLGINISYKSGANLWQIGPQIRYQHLPTYSNQYPIKEHLLDYGIRLGITRQWK
jgi:hypothetical protein